jgi:hypothetical protein
MRGAEFKVGRNSMGKGDWLWGIIMYCGGRNAWILRRSECARAKIVESEDSFSMNHGIRVVIVM